MRMLLIDDVAKDAIKKVMDHAEKNIFTMDDLLDRGNKQVLPPGDLIGFSCVLYNGFKVVYSIETQNIGKLKHISISVDQAGKTPSYDAVQMIMNEFGFKNKIKNCVKVHLEDIGVSESGIVCKAVNVFDLY